MNNKLLIFNWKMNPETLEEALQIAKNSDYRNSVVAPPFIFTEEVGKILKNAKLGAQDLFSGNSAKTSFTGEISAKELINLNVQYVIVGHSERRALGETDEIIAQKLKTSLDSNLVPILCVGESLEEHKAGKTKDVLRHQLETALSNFQLSTLNFKLIVAYEPIWAIGTGNPETPESVLETIKYIKKILYSKFYILNSRVLYGGSVTPENIKDFLKYKEIDGVLIGGASLKPEFFFK